MVLLTNGRISSGVVLSFMCRQLIKANGRCLGDFTFRSHPYFKPFHISYIINTFSLIRWFAKRFLHPDIVTEYDYIFLWDEDLGVEHFHPDK